MYCPRSLWGNDQVAVVRKQKYCGIRKKAYFATFLVPDADKSGSTDFSKESMLLLGNLLLRFWNMYLLTNPQFSLENRWEKKDVFLNCFLTVKKHRQTHKIREKTRERISDKAVQICFHKMSIYDNNEMSLMTITYVF